VAVVMQYLENVLLYSWYSSTFKSKYCSTFT